MVGDYNVSLSAPASRNSQQVTNDLLYVGVQVRDGSDGATILQVQRGSPAEQAGLLVGDVIVNVSGIPVDLDNTFVALTSQHMIGEQVEYAVLRNGVMQSVFVVLAQLLPSKIITPSAEILVNDATRLVVDIGFNGVTGVYVLEDWATVREPISGSEVGVPAGSAVLVVPGYEIGEPVPLSGGDVITWWKSAPLAVPTPPNNVPVPSVSTFVGLALVCICLGGIAITIILAIVFWARRKRK